MIAPGTYNNINPPLKPHQFFLKLKEVPRFPLKYSYNNIYCCNPNNR